MLIDALKNWSELGLPEKPTLLKEFSDGLNHHCGLIESGKQKYVAKLYQHSFNKSLRAEYLACETGVAPQIFSAANKLTISQYINDLGFNDERLLQLCQTIKKTHRIQPLDPEPINLGELLDLYLENAPDRIISWHTLLAPLISEFGADPTPLTFCHNDLVKENCLFDTQKAWLIDWEFAQLNNPWFDLGSIIFYFNLSSSQADRLLANYFGHAKFKASDRITQLAQICVLWCDLLWQISKRGPEYIVDTQDRFDDLAERAKRLGIELN